MERIVAASPGAVNSKKHASFQLATFKSTRCISEQFPDYPAWTAPAHSGGQGPGDKTA